MHTPVLLFFSNLFSSDMLIIIFIALLLFGGEKLPEIARGLGKGIRDFKDASEGVKREINNQINSFEEKREEKKLDEAAAAHQQDQPSSTSTETTAAAGVIRPAQNSVPVSDTHYNNNETTHNVAEHNIAEENKELQTEHVAENVHDTPDTNAGTSTK